MNTNANESLTVGVRIASIEMQPVVAAMKTLTDLEVKWESVSEPLVVTLVDKWHGLIKTVQFAKSTAADTVHCVDKLKSKAT